MPSRSWPFFLVLGLLFCPQPASALSSEMFSRAKGPVLLSADRMEFVKDLDRYLAEGSVKVDQGPLHLTADRATLDNATGQLTATGNVFFTDGANEIQSERLEMDLDTELGILYRARLFLKKESYHLQGEQVERVSDEVYRLDLASFTSCDCPSNPAWRFRARRIRLRLDHYIEARDVFFEIKGVPVFYLPYLIYPVITHRQTGLLVPQISYNTREGFKFGPALYWAISKSQDATVSLDYRSEKGIGGGLEYRYVLDRDSKGVFNGTFFRDTDLHQEQWQIRTQHQQRFSERLSARLDLNYVNQQNFFRDLSELTDERAARNVESNFIFNYRDQDSAAYLLARYTRDLTAPSSTTLQRLPEVGYSVFDYRVGGLPVYFRFDGTATNFWRETGLRAQRGDLYPRLLWPMHLYPGVTLTPQAGVRETLYSRSATTEESIHREGYPMGARLDLMVSRTGEAWTHLVQPSLTYEYIPFQNTSDVPQFDQIDLLHRKHQVTAQVDNALLWAGDGGMGREIAYLRLTDTYDIDRARLGDHRAFSELRQEAGLSPFGPMSLHVDAFYNFYDHRYNAVDTDLSTTAFRPLSLSVGHRFAREGTLPQKGDLFNPFSLGERVSTPRINYLTEKIVLRPGWGISLASKAYYDAERGGFDEIDYGIRYEAQCWTFTLVYLDLKEENQLSFMITLRGAGGFESKKLANLF